MAKNSVRDFSATAASNTDIQSVNIDESCPASGINNAIRELMADIKDVSTGTVNLETPAADRLDVDNIRIDGNTISSTDTNGNVTIDPNGTGKVIVPAAIEATTSTHANASVFKSTGNTQLFLQDTDASANDQFWGFQVSGGDFNILTCDDNRTSGFVTPVLINSSGHVKINNSRTTSVPFHVVGGTASGTTYDTAVFAGGQNSTSGSGAKIYLSGCENDPISRGTFISGIAVDNGNSHALTFATSGNSQAPAERMRIDNNGALRHANTSMAIDTSSNTATGMSVANSGLVHVATNSGTTGIVVQKLNGSGSENALFFLRGSSGVGSIRTTASATAFNTTSDHRLKENVTDMTGAIARVKQLAPKRFNFIVDADTTVDGFLAHEAQAVVPASCAWHTQRGG